VPSDHVDARPLLSTHEVKRALSVAVLIPCKDEAPTIAGVVSAFRRVLPQATIWVCDNGSTDETAAEAKRAGAMVVFEPRAGKGNAVRRLFSVADEEVCLLVDGDGTYDAESAPTMVETLIEGRLDMVIGSRVPSGNGQSTAYPRGHEWGNKAFTRAVSRLFNYPLDDIFSGYRAFSSRFLCSFPALSGGFEIEAEFTIHALDLGLPIREIPTPYGHRPHGSTSKLNTVADGLRIAWTLIHLYEQVRPVWFFGVISALLVALSLALGIPVVMEFIHTGLVPRLPTAVLAAAIMSLAVIAAVCGVILDSVGRGRTEAKRLAYFSKRR
jgi:glycosyltransferase involved in cell wall biosynthesis